MALTGIRMSLPKLVTTQSLMGSREATVRSAMDMGLTVVGMEEVKEALRNFDAMSIYVSVMTTKRTASAIHLESLKHTPYKEGNLFESSAVIKLEGPSGELNNPNDIFSKFTPVERNIEGTWAFGLDTPLGVPMVMPNWAIKSQYGTKMVTKWAVGYNTDGMAPHAVMVHENPDGREFYGGVTRMGQGKGPFKNEIKWDHFLVNAFDQISPQFEPSMRNALINVIHQVDRKAAYYTERARARAQAVSAGGLAARALGAPRLVKKAK